MKKYLSFIFLTLVNLCAFAQVSTLPSSLGTFEVFKAANLPVRIIMPAGYSILAPIVEIYSDKQVKLTDTTTVITSGDTVKFTIYKQQLTTLKSQSQFFVKFNGDDKPVLGGILVPTISSGTPLPITRTITLPSVGMVRVSLIGDGLFAQQAVDSARIYRDSAQVAREQAEQSAIDASNAASTALIQVGMYDTEALGRAAVANGQNFRVKGTGYIAAYEYKRIDSASSELVTTYPNGAVIPTLLPKTEALNFVQIGNLPSSATVILSSTTTCYVDFSIFSQACKLYQLDILTQTTGTFYLVHFRKTGPTTWTQIGKYSRTSTTASTSVYNHIDLTDLAISVKAGDCFGVQKITANFYSNSGVSGFSTQSVTDPGTGFTFTSSGFPGSPLTSGTVGRQLALRIYGSINRIDLNTENVTRIQSKILVIPADFDWSLSLASLANTECIISDVHTISNDLTLPTAIKFTFRSGGKILSTTTNKTAAYDFTNWSFNGNATVLTNKSFSTTSNGRIFKSGTLTQGKMYTVHIQGTTAASVDVLSSSSLTTFIPPQTGTFDVTYTVRYNESGSSLNIRSIGSGTTTINVLEVSESHIITSPATYGSTDEKTFPVISNVKGNAALNGAMLSGMFKAEEDIVQMADFFSNSYHSGFFDSFVRTKFYFEKSMVQTGDSDFSVNTNISDAGYKNYKGLSEGTIIEGAPGITLSNFYVFATGDFTVRTLIINTGRVNICNLYSNSRPLRFTMENISGVDFRVGNEYPHTAATSILTTPEFYNIRLTASTGTRNTIYLYSAIDGIFSDLYFNFTSYGGVGNEGGQPLVLLSSLNCKYLNINADNGDSGLMFCMFFPINMSAQPQIDWIESHAMDFKGFEGNLISGGSMSNMGEEAVTDDATDSFCPTVTMNRNRFQILTITNNFTAVVKAKYKDKKFETWVNTMMTSMTKGKSGKYAKVVSIVRTFDDTDSTKFTLTGPVGFFTGAAAGDKYSINYAFYNNVIEDMVFTNCRIPIQKYLYAYRDITRRVIVKGYISSKTGVSQLSYSGMRKTIYLAWSIDNIYENNVMDGNGFRFEDAKNAGEKYNPWLNSSPETYESDIAEDAESGTIIRNNTIKNGVIKLMGLRNIVYRDNVLINTVEEITDCTYRANGNTYTTEPDNENLDPIFSAVEVVGAAVIPVIPRGTGLGYTKLTFRLTQAVSVRISGNGSLYDDETGAVPARIKALSSVGVDAPVYARCFTGMCNVVVSTASSIAYFGSTADAVHRYSAANSPMVILKARFLPRDLSQLKQTAGALSLQGNFNNLPENISYVEIRDTTSSLYGRVIDLPRTATYISLKYPIGQVYTPSLKGSLTDLPPNCTYFQDETAGGYYGYTTRTWPAGMRKVHFRLTVRQTWTSAMVDQLLIDLAATTWASGGVIDIGSAATANTATTAKLPPRTAASNAAVNTLTTVKGVTVTIIN